MAEFAHAIEEAIASARSELDRARQEGDVDEAIIFEGRLEELHRLAAENGIDTSEVPA
jgi:hypothetical protein